jgi:hypothetical protein
MCKSVPYASVPHVDLYKIDHFEFCTDLYRVQGIGKPIRVFERDKCDNDETTTSNSGLHQRLICGWSRRTTFNNELWISMLPL